MLDVVESEQSVKEHYCAGRQLQVVLRLLGDLLQLADEIVADKTDRSACKGRHSGDSRRPVFVQKATNDGQ